MRKASKKTSVLLQEFKDFINRGSVIDLAVGVIVGGAFSKIVSSLVSDIIMPVVGILVGGIDFRHLFLTVPNLFGQSSSIIIPYGNFLQNVVDFLIVAFCIFLLVRFVNRLHKKPEAKSEKAKEDEQTVLLREIRDVLKSKKK